MIHKEGYERMVPEPSPNAVRWWLVYQDGDYVFARGGVCRTSRIARRLIREANQRMLLERQARAQALRPVFALLPNGELRQTWPLLARVSGLR